MPTVFRTNTRSTRIVKVEALELHPRYVILPTTFGKRRDKRETLYHRYHETFAAAHRYLEADWRSIVKKAKKHFDDATEALIKVQNLKGPVEDSIPAPEKLQL